MAAIDGRINPNVAALWHRYYPEYDPYPLKALVISKARPTDSVLEIGCGDGRNSPDLQGRVTCYAGIDPDERILANQKLDDARIGNAEDLPWPDRSFDLVFHSMVAEHLQEPISAMRETARVMKLGAVLLLETPSRWYYPMIVARITPHWFHEFWTQRLGSGRAAQDVFPTIYHCNSRSQIARAMNTAGLEGTIRHISTPPGYLRSHRSAFLAGVLYERTIERLFPSLRGKIIVEARLP